MSPDDLKTEAIKLAPPAGVSVTSFMGVPLSDWVYIVTIVYIFIQCGCLIYKTVKSKGGDK